MIIKDIVKGEHKGSNFEYNEGTLFAFGSWWDKERIKGLVEMATLLEAHGHLIKDRSAPTQSTGTCWYQASASDKEDSDE